MARSTRPQPDAGTTMAWAVVASLPLLMLTAVAAAQSGTPGAPLHFVCSPAGVVEPCGCQQNMAGGLSHVVAALRAGSVGGEQAPLFVVGPTFLSEPPATPGQRAQAERKARLLADSMGREAAVVWTPGPLDLMLGSEAFARLADSLRTRPLWANAAADDVRFDALRLTTVAGIPVGVVGLVTWQPGDSLPARLRLQAPELAARRALAALARQPVVLKLALIVGPRGASEALLRQVRGFDAVLWSPADSHMPTHTSAVPAAARIHGTWLLSAPPRFEAFGRVALGRGGAGVRVAPLPPLRIGPELGTAQDVASEVAGYHDWLGIQPPPPEPIGRPVPNGFVGADRCASCHDVAHAFWLNTPHARAFWTLQRRRRAHDQDCVACHVTGARTPAGTAVGTGKTLPGVQCEVCHGAGAAHADSQRPEAIQLKPPQGTCLECHKPPHVNANWDLSEAWERIVGTGHGGR